MKNLFNRSFSLRTFRLLFYSMLFVALFTSIYAFSKYSAYNSEVNAFENTRNSLNQAGSRVESLEDEIESSKATLKKVEENPDAVGEKALEDTTYFIDEVLKLDDDSLLDRRQYIEDNLSDYVDTSNLEEMQYEQIEMPDDYEVYVGVSRSYIIPILLVSETYGRDATTHIFEYDARYEKVVGRYTTEAWGDIK